MSSDGQKILMCAPDFFTVDYVINPWMAGHESSLDRASRRMRESWWMRWTLEILPAML